MHIHHSRIFIGVGHIFGDVLHDELVCLTLHIRSYKTSKIQVWSAVQVQLIFEHGMNGVCIDSFLRNPELGDLLTGGIS